MSQDRPRGDSPASDDPPLSAWLTKHEAAQALGKSIKTIERYAISRRKALRLRKAERPTPGRKPVPVYHPDDVQRLKKALDAELVRSTEESKTYAPSALVATKSPPAVPGQLALAAILERLSKPPEAAPVRVTEKMLLTVAEAAELGWPEAELWRLVREGKLRNFGGPGKYRIARADLEKLLETHRMICMGCGCTDDKPCITPEGPCSWVAPGICSRCVAEAQPRIAAPSEMFR